MHHLEGLSVFDRQFIHLVVDVIEEVVVLQEGRLSRYYPVNILLCMIHVVVSVMAHHYGILAEILRVQKCLGEGIEKGPTHVSGAAIAHCCVHCYQRTDGLR